MYPSRMVDNLTSGFDTDPCLAIKSLAAILCSKLKGILDPPRMLELEPDVPIRKLATYAQ